MNYHRYQFPATGTLHRSDDDAVDLYMEGLESCMDARGINNGDYNTVLTCFPDRKNGPVIERVDICADVNSNIKALDIYTSAELEHGMEEVFRSHVEEQVAKANDSLINMMITGPVTKENIVGQVKNVCGMFDFENVTFTFGEATRPDEHLLDDDAGFRLLDAFEENIMDDLDISPYMGDFSDDILESVRILAEQARDEGHAFNGDITVEKGEGRSIDILVNGRKEVNVNLEVYIECNEGSRLLPNGDAAVAMYGYDWQQFESLEAAVKAQAAEFADSLNAMDRADNGIER